MKKGKGKRLRNGRRGSNKRKTKENREGEYPRCSRVFFSRLEERR
jgi:hypothetical protein